MKFLSLMMFLSLSITSAFAQDQEPKVVELGDQVTSYLQRIWTSNDSQLMVSVAGYEPMRVKGMILNSKNPKKYSNREAVLVIELVDVFTAFSLGELRNFSWNNNSYSTGKCMVFSYQPADSATNPDARNNYRAVYFDLKVVDAQYVLASYLITPKQKYGFRNDDEIDGICNGTLGLDKLTDTYSAEKFDLHFMK